ncbi:MAG: Flp family type IVb pilin [Pseudomonadota bacterium]
METRETAALLYGYALGENGASLIEYSLLIGLVSIGILTAITSISGNLGPVWSALASIVAQVASG